MKRRDSIKGILVGSLSATAIMSCKDEATPFGLASQQVDHPSLYGRSEEERIRDEKLNKAESPYSDEEMQTIKWLVDIIVPSDEKGPKASDAGVVEFIDFISKDIEDHQLIIKSGLAWVNRKSYEDHQKSFNEIASEEKMVLVNQIAFPFEAPPSFAAGVKFFSRMRDLTLTGYYTSKDGLKDIGYVGNTPNFWDGVPQDVLEKYGFELDAKYKDLYITEAKRNNLAKWDSIGNLIG